MTRHTAAENKNMKSCSVYQHYWVKTLSFEPCECQLIQIRSVRDNLLHVSPVSQDQQVKDEKRPREHKPTERRDQDERNTERKRPREDVSPRRTEDKSRVQETKDREEDESSKNTKKKKKKEKKMKKKDKKKEKKKKDKAGKN